MNNNIMAAGSRNRPPMLVLGRCAQWQSRFKRYVYTRPNNDALKKCILQGPYKLSNIIIPEKEAIHLLLTRTGDEIYSIVDACKTAHDMLIAIDRLQQDGESIESYYSRFHKMMNEMVRNQLEVATMQVNVQFLQQLQPEWSRFVTIVKQTIDLDKESYHKHFDILKQYQKQVNEICVEKITKNSTPLALVAATQQYPDTYYQAPKSHMSYAPPAKTSPSTRSHTNTRCKGKEIAKPITPPSESASKEDSDP
ncbi:hypothetical protein Tco_0051316 [Tanacetum coccineum]